MADDLKLINYGGILQFRMPCDWIEEYEEEGGAKFYEPHPDAGILRLNILTYRTPGPVSATEISNLLAGMARGRHEPVAIHADGSMSIAAWESGDEDGEPLAIRTWCIGSWVPPDCVRIALFTYTMLESQRDHEAFTRDVAMIDREVRSCHFAERQGE